MFVEGDEVLTEALELRTILLDTPPLAEFKREVAEMHKLTSIAPAGAEALSDSFVLQAVAFADFFLERIGDDLSDSAWQQAMRGAVRMVYLHDTLERQGVACSWIKGEAVLRAHPALIDALLSAEHCLSWETVVATVVSHAKRCHPPKNE